MSATEPFEPVLPARYEQHIVDGTEWITVRAPRNWFAFPFLIVWLTFWTFAGSTVLTQIFGGKVDLFLLVWIVFWALGWCMAASWLMWLAKGESAITVTRDALVFRWSMPLISRTKRYDARAVRNLRGGATIWPLTNGVFYTSLPPFFPSMRGGLRFDYGAQTVTVMNDLDETEGNLVARWVEARLPEAKSSVPRADR
jgi:hypothetical protein